MRDPDKPNYLIDTNEYLVTHGSQGILLDPGGAEVFPAVFSALSSEFDPSALSAIFASHQYPDICSSLALWLEFNPKMRCYVSWLWSSFIPHVVLSVFSLCILLPLVWVLRVSLTDKLTAVATFNAPPTASAQNGTAFFGPYFAFFNLDGANHYGNDSRIQGLCGQGQRD